MEDRIIIFKVVEDAVPGCCCFKQVGIMKDAVPYATSECTSCGNTIVCKWLDFNVTDPYSLKTKNMDNDISTFMVLRAIVKKDDDESTHSMAKKLETLYSILEFDESKSTVLRSSKGIAFDINKSTNVVETYVLPCTSDIFIVLGKVSTTEGQEVNKASLIDYTNGSTIEFAGE